MLWLNGSDNPPPHDREIAYLDVEKETHWNKPVISSATAKDTDVTGKTGVKMSGPYEYVPANYWTIDTKNGGAYGFNTETSPGPAVPPLEELKTFIPEDKLWPINDYWSFHAGGGQFKTLGIYDSIKGGKLTITGEAKDDSPHRAMKGRMEMTSFRLLHTPTPRRCGSRARRSRRPVRTGQTPRTP